MTKLLPDGYILFGCSVLMPCESNMFAIYDDNFIDGFNGKAIVNSQLLPDYYIANEQDPNYNVYFNNVKIYDKNQKIISKFNVDKINHECIFGTNAPRYYTPSFDYSKINKNILLIRNEVKTVKDVSDLDIIDNYVTEYDIEGNILWNWSAVEHIDQLGLSDEYRETIKTNKIGDVAFGEENDWIHLNAAIALGENKWYDEGDERFHPENIMICSRNLSNVYIIEKTTGNVIYSLRGADNGFEFQHYAHLIPKGLPGEGNILLLNNHSDSDPNIMEINPVTKEIVCKYTGNFTSKSMGSVQKLIDGSYLICCSNNAKAIRLDKDGKHVTTWAWDKLFYRLNAYPKEWLV